MMKTKIAFGGGCHWCTEAVFQSLVGVRKVDQGFVASAGDYSSFSEAVIVHYDSSEIDLEILIEIHLRTHRSTSEHSMRSKYRSAVYTFSEEQHEEVKQSIVKLQSQFDSKLITTVLPFNEFKMSDHKFQNYYLQNPEKPFCQMYIDPKLKLIQKQYSKFYKENKLDYEKL